MGLEYNKNVLYPRPITLAKRYLRFISVMGLTCLIKLVWFLYLIHNGPLQGQPYSSYKGNLYNVTLIHIQNFLHILDKNMYLYNSDMFVANVRDQVHN